MSKKSTHFLRLTIAALLAAVTLLQSCSKGDDNTPKPANPSTPKDSNELIMGTWHVTALTSDVPYRWEDTVNGTDGFTYRKDCAGKTTFTFTKGTTAGSGPFALYSDCRSTTTNGTWSLANGYLELPIGQVKVEKLDDAQLSISYRIIDPNTGNSEVKITYVLARN